MGSYYDPPMLITDQVVEEEYQYDSHTHSIYNTWALAMLLQWLPSLPAKERSWLAERVYDIISFGAHNKQRCCGAGLINVVVEVICASQEEGGFSEEVEGQLVNSEIYTLLNAGPCSMQSCWCTF